MTMGKAVTNLKMMIQSGTTNTLVAKWDFDDSITRNSSSSGNVRVGDWVTIKDGATYYNGVAIPSWVKNQEWQVMEVIGDRAVINKNRSGSNSIMSPINVNNLIGGSGGGGSSDTTYNTLDHYAYTWFYDAGDGFWYIGSSGDDEFKNNYATYTIPDNAINVHFHIIPVSKTYKVNNKDTSYWTGDLTIGQYSTSTMPPKTPSTPSADTTKDYYIEAKIDNISDALTDKVEFQIWDANNKLYNSGTGTVEACRVSYKAKIEAGGVYRVRARAVNLYGNGEVYSEWTSFTSEVKAIPSVPEKFTTARAESSTSAYFEWPEVKSATKYEIQYATKLSYFDNSSSTTTVSNIEHNHYEVTGLETGNQYYFRVRAINDKGSSAYSEAVGVVVGKTPAAPTTWSSSTTAIVGKELNLYWVHNAADNSRETYAEIQITINDGTPATYTHKDEYTDTDGSETTKVYSVDTSKLGEGATIKWMVRTAGVTKTFGPWSVVRVVNVYAQPTLDLKITNQNSEDLSVVTSFPFYIKGLAGPNTQMPLGYHVTVVSNTDYTSVDTKGLTVNVRSGDSVYSKYIDTSDALLVRMSANSIDLQNGASYTVTVIASMNSGLTVTETKTFSVSWVDAKYQIDAQIAVDPTNWVAYISPTCYDSDNTVLSGVTISVYRREYDGNYTLIASGIKPENNTVITDPHPTLDYARYRIVVISDSTGSVSFYDPPPYPVGGSSVVIQWDEAWESFDVTNLDPRADPQYSGSVLLLHYNIDVTDNNSSDVSFVEYAGRKYPVSYYSEKLSSTPTWNVDVPADDKETIYALRRLANWNGDVYVREPSGSGYWANVSVSFSIKHNELVVPVSIKITRVEGGM